MLTEAQLSSYAERGLIELPGAVARAHVDAMAESIWEITSNRLGVQRDQPDSWKRVPPSIVKPLKREGGFTDMASAVVRGALDQLLGADAWADPSSWGQLLMSIPFRSEWVVPHKVWHLDFPSPAYLRAPPGAQIFLFLERVEPRSGGTLVIAGSHQLIADLQAQAPDGDLGRSRDVRSTLRGRVPWLHDLWSRGGSSGERIDRFMSRSTRIDGAALQVVEMTGAPGDVIVMHPWAIHAPSLNCGTRMRMMMTERLRTREFHWEQRESDRADGR